MAQQGQFYILYPPSEARPLGGWGTVSRDRAEKAEAEADSGEGEVPDMDSMQSTDEPDNDTQDNEGEEE